MSSHGFVQTGRRQIAELSALARIYRHERTGARLLTLSGEDENKVFGASFRTPPPDSTGVAHILEHSVLCGSRKYPVKEPFVELLKGSLQTFLNALTFPDKTCYPVASTNVTDFHNLADVYLDAVLHPRLSPWLLMQEGWRLDPVQGGGLNYKGVVYNEMKGAYSSPDGLLAEYSQRSLFPDSPYGLDSGGDPRVIPKLTWPKFRGFHERYYHPSNGWFYFSGDDPENDRLALLASFLDEFKARPVDSQVPAQGLFAKPRRMVRPYAADSAGDSAMCTVNFLLGHTAEPEANFALRVLEHILIGLPSSPLRKALLDSGLGEDLAGVGLELDLRQMYFSVGLKGMRASDAGKVERIVLKECARLSKEGLDPEAVEAGLNSVEFALRENNTGSFPRGLSLMFRSLSTWLHDQDPLALLAFQKPLDRIKAKAAKAGKHGYFEALLARGLTENPHRTRVLLVPDPEEAARMNAREKATLTAVAERIGPKGLAKAMEQAEVLDRMQQAQDSPEALALIPRLKVADLPLKNAQVPFRESTVSGVPLFRTDLPTSGILYLDLGFDLSTLPERLLPLVPVFGQALLESGTADQSFETLTRRIAGRTGGIESQTVVLPTLSQPKTPRSLLFLRGKTAPDRVADLFAILTDVLTTARLNDQERLRQIVLESKAGMEEHLIPGGHSFVALRIKAALSLAGAGNERLHGLSQLFFLRELAERVDRDFPSVVADMEEVRRLVLTRAGLTASATAQAPGLDEAASRLAGLVEVLPTGGFPAMPRTIPDLPAPEGLAVPAQVHYVGKGADVYAAGVRFNGSMPVVVRHLRAGYLWERVRVRGGAYGAFCLFDRLSGSLALVSYRDPNLAATLDIFDAAAEHVADMSLDTDSLEKAVIGAIGEMDAYQLPDGKSFTALMRHFTGETEDFRQKTRDEALACTAQAMRGFATALQVVADKGRVCVLGPEESLKGSGRGFAITRAL